MAYVEAFWAHAQPQLYPGASGDAETRVRTLNTIWAGVYAGFRDGPTADEWRLYHRQALERVDLVAGWLKRHLGHYLPAPYAEVIAGRGYFDRDNPHGFVQTEEWLARKQANGHTRRVGRVLGRAAADFRGWHARTPLARLRDLPKAHLMQKHLRKVQALQDPTALQEFHRLSSGQA